MSKWYRNRSLRGLCAGAVLIGLGTPLSAEIEVLAQTGDPAPDGLGVFSSTAGELVQPPAVNNHGQVVFAARCVLEPSADRKAVILAVPGEPLRGLGSGGGSRPPGATTNPTLAGKRPMALLLGWTSIEIDSGSIFGPQTTFVSTLFSWSDGEPEALVNAARPEFHPDPNQTSFSRPSINAANQIALGVLVGRDLSLYRYDVGSPSPLVSIARARTVTPSGVGYFDGIGEPSLSDSGQIAFYSSIAETETLNDAGIFVGDGTSLTKVARVGEEVPGGTTIQRFGRNPSINSSGQIAFQATWIDGAQEQGVFLFSGDAIVPVALTGDTDPDGDMLKDIQAETAINDSGCVAFLSNTTAYPPGSKSLFAGFDGEIIKIARVDDPIPAGDGVFRPFNGTFDINSAGQIAFQTLIRVAGTPLEAIFLYTPGVGLTEIVREGDTLGGGLVSYLAFSGHLPKGASGLNDAGQVAFRFHLADRPRSSGVALYTPPDGIGATAQAENLTITIDGDGTRVLDWDGPNKASFRVEFDQDAVPTWSESPVAPILVAPGKWQWKDNDPSLPPTRLYRVR